MRKALFIYSLVTSVVIAVLATTLSLSVDERDRLRQNQASLCSEVEHYRTRSNEEAATVQILRLRCGEYEEMRAADAERIRQLGLRIRRLESTSKSVTTTSLDLRAPIIDTVILRDSLPATTPTIAADTASLARDSVRLFRWRDNWVSIEGTIGRDSVACKVESVDTLHQIVHRVPRRFLFFRYGTKALRQEIISSNPHTRIVYTEYIKIERRRDK